MDLLQAFGTDGGSSFTGVAVCLSETREGVRALLNLRLTCSTLKNWIDNYRSLSVTCASAVVKNPRNPNDFNVDLHEQMMLAVNNFIRTPCPPFIASLEYDGEFPPETRTREDYESWEIFLNHWMPTIRKLRLSKLEYPMNHSEIKFFQNVKLSVLNVDRMMLNYNRWVGNPQQFPPLCIRKVEDFRLGGCGSPLDSGNYLLILRNNPVLNHLQLAVESVLEINLLIKVLQQHKNNLGFTAQVNLKRVVVPHRSPLARALCQTILTSQSRFEFFDAIPPPFEWLLYEEKPSDKYKILSKIKSVMGWRKTDGIPLSKFRSLVYIGSILVEHEVQLEDFPSTIEMLKIGISRIIPFNHWQLAKLKVIIIRFAEDISSMSYIRDVVTALQKKCKILTHMTLFFGEIIFQEEDSKRIQHPPVIESLTSLRIFMAPSYPVVRRYLLVSILRLPDLSRLRSLEISGVTADIQKFGTPVEIETGTILMLTKGMCNKSLKEFSVRFDREARLFLPIAEGIYNPLIQLAAANSRTEHGEAKTVIPGHFHLGQFCPTFEHLPPVPLNYG